MKTIVILTLLLLWVPGVGDPAQNLKLLTIKSPAGDESFDDHLLINLETAADIAESLIRDISAKARADIEFTTVDHRAIAQLGRVRNQKIRWTHRVTGNNFLMVPCAAADRALIYQLIDEMVPRPGYQIAVVDPDSRAILNSAEVTFLALPDLTVVMQYPVNIPPDHPFGDRVLLHIRNNGSVTASMFTLEVVVSSEPEIPVRPVPYTEDFQGLSRLHKGKVQIDSLNPGESREIRLDPTASLPPGLNPGKFYLAAVIDAADQVRETDEKNNVHRGFLMVTFPLPEMVTIALPATRLIYQPAVFDVQVISQAMTISRKNEWRKCNIRPHLFQLRHASWKDFHWEIDTIAHQVWRVSGAEFCKRGGDARELRMTMRVTGGSDSTVPDRVILLLENARMEYQPGDKRLRITSYGDMLIHVPFWSAGVLSNHLFHIGSQLWDNFFLEINARDRTVSRVTGGDFLQPAESSEKLDVALVMEEK